MLVPIWLAALTATVAAPPTLASELGPREAIFAAADAAPAPVAGLFVLEVRAGGRQRGRIFLNSELDYRDQRNLTIRLEPRAAAALERELGMPPEDFFIGKSIRVRGEARRVRIDFLDSGQPSGLYYYQTHVPVIDPAEIEIVEESRD